jgi:hypothetical protein
MNLAQRTATLGGTEPRLLLSGKKNSPSSFTIRGFLTGLHIFLSRGFLESSNHPRNRSTEGTEYR